MNPNPNDITFIIGSDGEVIIKVAGGEVTPADFAGMYMDARAKHNQITARGFGMSSHSGYFDDCKECRQWSVAERMYRAVKK